MGVRSHGWQRGCGVRAAMAMGARMGLRDALGWGSGGTDGAVGGTRRWGGTGRGGLRRVGGPWGGTDVWVPRTPMVTGTSVLGVKFEGGVVIAADMMGSYGSLARFRSISRLLRVNDSTVLGASGDYADFQYLTQIINQMV